MASSNTTSHPLQSTSNVAICCELTAVGGWAKCPNLEQYATNVTIDEDMVRPTGKDGIVAMATSQPKMPKHSICLERRFQEGPQVEPWSPMKAMNHQCIEHEGLSANDHNSQRSTEPVVDLTPLLYEHHDSKTRLYMHFDAAPTSHGETIESYASQQVHQMLQALDSSQRIEGTTLEDSERAHPSTSRPATPNSHKVS